MSISKNRSRLHASRLDVPARRLLAVADERLPRAEHGRVPRGSCAPPRRGALPWWCCCAAAHAQLFAFAGKNRRTWTPGALRAAMRRIIPRSADVRVHDVEGCAPPHRGGSAIAVVVARERSRRVVEDHRGDRVGTAVELRDSASSTLACDTPRPSQPYVAEEEEVELRDDLALDVNEQAAEAAVPEVVLDLRAADPADPAVDDHDLAVVDELEAALRSSDSSPPAPSGPFGERELGSRTMKTPRRPSRAARRGRVSRRSGSDLADRRRPCTATPARALSTRASANASPTARRRPG